MPAGNGTFRSPTPSSATPVPAETNVGVVAPPPAELNVAVQFVGPVTRTSTTGAVPLHAPLQPAKVTPTPGVAVSCTGVSGAKSASQALPGTSQAIPSGSEVTKPLPTIVTASDDVPPPPPVAEST